MKGGGLVAGDVGVDAARPLVDTADERLRVVETLVAQPQGDRERTRAVVAHDDDRLVRIELGVGAGGNLAHGDEGGSGDGGTLVLPGLAHV